MSDQTLMLQTNNRNKNPLFSYIIFYGLYGLCNFSTCIFRRILFLLTKTYEIVKRWNKEKKWIRRKYCFYTTEIQQLKIASASKTKCITIKERVFHELQRFSWRILLSISLLWNSLVKNWKMIYKAWTFNFLY